MLVISTCHISFLASGGTKNNIDTSNPFREAKFWADKINDNKAIIKFTTDAGIGKLLQSGKITKVIFGAYQWNNISTKKVWFTNTPGTYSISIMANKFNIPIYVIAEQTKLNSDLLDDKSNLINTKNDRAIKPEITETGLPINYVEHDSDIINSEETMNLLSAVRMGVNLDLIKGISIAKINELFIQTQPAHLQIIEGRTLEPEERDSLRAKLIRERLEAAAG